MVHTYCAASGYFPKPRVPLTLTEWGFLEALTLQPFALQLPGAANGFRGFAGPTLGRLFVVPPQLHLAENTLPLHFLFERLQRLINVVVTHENLHLAACSYPGRPQHRVRGCVRRQGFRHGGWRYNMVVDSYKPILRHQGLDAHMAILKIARMGHPILLRKCDPVSDPGAPEIRRLVADMIETMEDAPGVGLAAPQVYQPLRLFVFRVPGGRESQDPDDITQGNTVLINPTVDLIGEERVLGWEGCLSIPGLRAAVPRATRIRYRGVDCDGNVTEQEVTGFHARVVQHEYDHLDGILYTMRLTDFRYFGFTDELDRPGAKG
jgi:peptide deformylase